MAGLTGASAGHLGFCSKLGLSLPALGTSRELAVGWGWEEVREQGSVDDLLEKFGPEDTESGNRATALTQGFLRGELGLVPVGSPALIGVGRIRSTQTRSSGWEKSHLDWQVPVVQWMLEAVSTSSRGQDPTPGPLRSAALPSGPLTQLREEASSPLPSAATPLGRREQIAEPCYLQAFKWVIES